MVKRSPKILANKEKASKPPDRFSAQQHSVLLLSLIRHIAELNEPIYIYFFSTIDERQITVITEIKVI